ncbi:hypothetical protein diail_7030 [Diaporthe ilicicola]|nr:hypothetical protein diail_7030 [Diaporthe ilicicola]
MPKRRGTRLVAQRLLEDAAQDNELDYFGQFTKRIKPNDDPNGEGSTSNIPQKQADHRTARFARREAAKLGKAQGVRDQAISRRPVMAQRAEEDDNEDESGDSSENEDDDEEAGPDGVDLDRITQAINQARNRTMKPTINGIGTRQGDQSQDTGASSDDGESSEEGLFVSQSSDGEEVDAPQSSRDRSRESHGSREARQRNDQRGRTAHDRPAQNHKPETEDENDAESPSVIDSDIADDSAFVEAPRQGEKLATVKVVINSMGGIFKTLQHQAWTRSANWARHFESEDSDDDHKTCETASGKALMDEMQGLNDVLGEAANTPQESSEDEHDFTTIIANLRAKSVDVQQHLTRINRLVDKICSRELRPPPPAAGEIFIARVIETRQAILRDISRRLVPMLLMTVKKASSLCPSEDHRSKITLHLDCFTLQFFLRPLAWASRLQEALQKGLEQWPQTKEPQNDADDPEEGASEAEESEKNARSVLRSQMDALYSAVKKAEREIQDIAVQAERKEREAQVKNRNQARVLGRQQVIAAARQREQKEQAERDEKSWTAFVDSVNACRNKLDPLKQLWDQSQAALPMPFRATSTQGAAPGVSLSGHGQRRAGAVRPVGGASRNDRVEVISDSDSDADDPFSENYQPPPETPVANRNTSSNNPLRSHLSGSGSARAWSEEEDKTIIWAIRYKRTYDVVSMARKLGRSQDDVAKKAAFLKQGYREAYTQRRVEIPDWAW